MFCAGTGHRIAADRTASDASHLLEEATLLECQEPRLARNQLPSEVLVGAPVQQHCNARHRGPPQVEAPPFVGGDVAG